MYAIVEIAGQQFKVEEGKKIFVHRLEATEEKVSFDKVLMIAGDDTFTVGTPVVANAVVEGKILDHVRGDKVVVFKKKRKKGYRVKNGHRQDFTQVEILSISLNGSKKKVSKKAEAEAGAEPVAEKKASPRKQAVASDEQGEKAPEKATDKKEKE
jgi:large subunit ribosomal protein L21